jgi:PAS domain S-box-containing protein
MKRRTISLVESLFSAIAERFAALTQVAYDGVFIYEAGKILNATRGAAALFGRDPHELHDCHVDDLVVTESRPILRQHLAAVNRTSCPAMAVRCDGTTLPIEVTVQANLTLHGRNVKVISLRDATRDEERDYLSDRSVARRRLIEESALSPRPAA